MQCLSTILRTGGFCFMLSLVVEALTHDWADPAWVNSRDPSKRSSMLSPSAAVSALIDAADRKPSLDARGAGRTPQDPSSRTRSHMPQSLAVVAVTQCRVVAGRKRFLEEENACRPL